MRTTATATATTTRRPGSRRRAVALVALLATGVLATGCGATSSDAGPEPVAAATAEAPTPSVVARPTTAIDVHESPDATSPARSIEPTTEFGSARALLVTSQADGWVQVLVPGRPTGATGWVTIEQAGTLQAVTTEIRVDLAARTLTLLDGGTEVLTTPVAIGAPDSPTPTGTFSVTDKLDTQSPDGDYGRYAFGLSGRSEVLTEFAGGDGQIGIHGTNDPASIGRPVSHGCIRVPNDVMEQLNRVLPLGTPVVVS